jgi:hypothetical protein
MSEIDLLPIIIIVFVVIFCIMGLFGVRTIKKELKGVSIELKKIDQIIKDTSDELREMDV